jgi:malonate decarboxylase alpha subunit
LRDETDPLAKGQKLVVQMVETYGSNKKPVFVETLDALAVQKQAGLANAPIMIYSEDTTHIVTEEGIAYLYKANSKEEKQAAIAAIGGVTPLGMTSTKASLDALRKAGIVKLPEDLGIKRSDAKRSLLAAQTVDDLIEWSDGLYEPPMKFRTWS